MSVYNYFKSVICLFGITSLKNYCQDLHTLNTSISSLNMSQIIKLEDKVKSSIVAAEFIKQGSVIAIPTDTLYGFAADAQNSEAIEKLYAVKKRQHTKPLAICVANVSDISNWGKVDHIPKKLLTYLLPGPVTIVLYRTDKLNPDLNPNNLKVAVRIPKHDFVRQMVSLLGGPIALTSANESNATSSVCIDDFRTLWPKVSAIFDAGTIGSIRTGSTIIDLTTVGKYMIVRKGSDLENTTAILNMFNISEI